MVSRFSTLPVSSGIFSWEGGRIIVNRKVMKKFWGFSGITSIQLFLAPDVINSSVVDPRGEDGIGRTMLKIRDLMENRRQKALKNMDSAIHLPLRCVGGYDQRGRSFRV